MQWQGRREKTWVPASSLEANKAAVTAYEAGQTKQRKELEAELEENKQANGDTVAQKKKRTELLKHSKGKSAPRWIGEPVLKRRGRTYYKVCTMIVLLSLVSVCGQLYCGGTLMFLSSVCN